MTDRDAQAEEVLGRIRAVLFKDWDPIGVSGDPEWPHDEYDAYAGGVYRLLASGATEEQVAEHLLTLERDYMGFNQASIADLLPVARRLLALNVKLGDGSVA